MKVLLSLLISHFKQTMRGKLCLYIKWDLVSPTNQYEKKNIASTKLIRPLPSSATNKSKTKECYINFQRIA